MPEFGTSGLRGLADDLTDDLVARYVAAFAKRFSHDGTLFMGRDLRASSPRIARAVVSGAAMAGLRVLDCGVVPTPALAMAALSRPTLAVMVTGSHIPADRNGLKFYTSTGEITKSDEELLAAEVERSHSIEPVSAEIKAIDVTTRFVARYVDFFGPKALDGLTVGLWEQSSAGREVLHAILNQLGAKVAQLERLDTFVAVDTEAVDGQLRDKLASWANVHGLDAVVSTDGDGDRPLLTDAVGNVVPGDILGPITARMLGATDIVTPVSANTLVDLMGEFRVNRCQIGSPYVIAGMETLQGRVFGYEPNGGVLLGYPVERAGKTLAPLMTRDSILPIVAVLSASRCSSVADLVSALPHRRTATFALKGVPREDSKSVVRRLLAREPDLLPAGLGRLKKVDQIDGVRMSFDNGIIVSARPSGNAPEMRVYVEADSQEQANAVLAAALEHFGNLVRQRG